MHRGLSRIAANSAPQSNVHRRHRASRPLRASNPSRIAEHHASRLPVRYSPTCIAPLGFGRLRPIASIDLGSSLNVATFAQRGRIAFKRFIETLRRIYVADGGFLCRKPEVCTPQALFKGVTCSPPFPSPLVQRVPRNFHTAPGLFRACTTRVSDTQERHSGRRWADGHQFPTKPASNRCATRRAQRSRFYRLTLCPPRIPREAQTFMQKSIGHSKRPADGSQQALIKLWASVTPTCACEP